MACQCEFCQWSKVFNKVMEDVPTEHHAFFRNLVDNMLDIELDRDYYKAIVRNEWPDSDKILSQYRK